MARTQEQQDTLLDQLVAQGSSFQANLSSLNDSQAAQQASINNIGTFNNQVKAKHNLMIDKTAELFDQVDGINDDDAALAVIYNPARIV